MVLFRKWYMIPNVSVFCSYRKYFWWVQKDCFVLFDRMKHTFVSFYNAGCSRGGFSEQSLRPLRGLGAPPCDSPTPLPHFFKPFSKTWQVVHPGTQLRCPAPSLGTRRPLPLCRALLWPLCHLPPRPAQLLGVWKHRRLWLRCPCSAFLQTVPNSEEEAAHTGLCLPRTVWVHAVCAHYVLGFHITSGGEFSWKNYSVSWPAAAGLHNRVDTLHPVAGRKDEGQWRSLRSQHVLLLGSLGSHMWLSHPDAALRLTCTDPSLPH